MDNIPPEVMHIVMHHFNCRHRMAITRVSKVWAILSLSMDGNISKIYSKYDDDDDEYDKIIINLTSAFYDWNMFWNKYISNSALFYNSSKLFEEFPCSCIYPCGIISHSDRFKYNIPIISFRNIISYVPKCISGPSCSLEIYNDSHIILKLEYDKQRTFKVYYSTNFIKVVE